MIQLKNVFVKRGSVEVLHDINVEIQEGEKVAILGGNASGKSTLLDLLGGKTFPSRGKLVKPHYSKIALVHRDYSFHKVVGAAYQYYQQRYHAFDSEIGPTLWEVIQNQVKPLGTVDDNSVELPPLVYDEIVVQQVAEQMNISHLLQRKVTTLSNGETRRALIALSLLKNPALLLLDNPVTGLDEKSKSSLKSVLSNLKITVVIVCGHHDIPEGFNRRLVLKKGKLRDKSNSLSDISLEQQIFKAKESLSNQIDKTFLNDFKVAFSITNGWVHYGQKKALDKINWQVKAGEKWALMGPNGSGKSTLLSLIMADNPQAYQNDITLFDQKRGSGESIWELKKRTGFISPEYHMYFPKNQRVWKVVASGLFDTIGLLKELNKDQEDTLNLYLNLLNIEATKERPLNELSTGEQRQVLLARALIKNPPLLVLDEPCQSLDYSHMVYFRDLIDKVVSTLNKTLIYVTHNKEEIPACVNKTLYLADGEVLKVEE